MYFHNNYYVYLSRFSLLFSFTSKASISCRGYLPHPSPGCQHQRELPSFFVTCGSRSPTENLSRLGNMGPGVHRTQKPATLQGLPSEPRKVVSIARLSDYGLSPPSSVCVCARTCVRAQARAPFTPTRIRIHTKPLFRYVGPPRFRKQTALCLTVMQTQSVHHVHRHTFSACWL